MFGPHNNKLHKITSITESFKDKFCYIDSIVKSNLIEKSNILMENLNLIENNIQEIKNVKANLENELRIDYTRNFENIR